MALLKKRLSKDCGAASPTRAKIAKTNAPYTHLMMNVRRQQERQLGIMPSPTIRYNSKTEASPSSSPPRPRSNKPRSNNRPRPSMVTPCMASTQEELSQYQDCGAMPSGQNTIPSPSSLPSLPFQNKTRVLRPQNPLEMLSKVSNHIPLNASITTGTKTTMVPPKVKKEQPQANKEEHSYVGERNSSGRRHGRGVMKYTNGCRYVGYFAHDKRDGFGKVWYPNGLGVYTGYWRHNKRHGSGTMHFANGDIYEGQWRDDEPSGVGTLTRINGETYMGDIVNWQKHGHGVYKWPNGDMYEGEWRKNSRHGAGILVPANGKAYNQIYFNGTHLPLGEAAVKQDFAR